jgi:hypothetical protein
MRKSTVFSMLFAVMMLSMPLQPALAKDNSMDNVKTILTEFGERRPLNSRIFAEEFLQQCVEHISDKPVPEQFWTRVQDEAHAILNKADQKGEISKVQLRALVNKPSSSDVAARVEAALYANFDDIYRDQVKSQKSTNGKIDLKGVDDYFQAAKAGDYISRDAGHIVFWAEGKKNLDRFSTNSSGVLSYSDLVKLQKRPDISPIDQHMIADLKEKFPSMAKNGLIGKSEIDAYYAKVTKGADYQRAVTFSGELHYVGLALTDPAAKQLFKDQKSPISDIKADAIEQGESEDCTFKATLIALAAFRPTEVLSMIKHYDQHQATVAFPSSKETYDVPAPMPQVAAVYGRQNGFGYWPTTIEAAYGQKLFHELDAKTKREMQNLPDEERAGFSQYPSDAIRRLTGHGTSVFKCSDLTAKQLNDLLTVEQSDHRVVLFGAAIVGNKFTSVDGFTMGHSHAFLGIDKTGLVTVRDPRVGGGDGNSVVSTEVVLRNFQFITVEDNK